MRKDSAVTPEGQCNTLQPSGASPHVKETCLAHTSGRLSSLACPTSSLSAFAAGRRVLDNDDEEEEEEEPAPTPAKAEEAPAATAPTPTEVAPMEEDEDEDEGDDEAARRALIGADDSEEE